MNEKDQKIIGQEGIHTVMDGTGELKAVIRRDPVSKKHLVYFVREGTSEEIAEFIKTNLDKDK